MHHILVQMNCGGGRRVWPGWDAAIRREGQTWLSPWTLEINSKTEFVIVLTGDGPSDIDEPVGYQQAYDILAEFTAWRGLQRQSSMALMAALNIPTHNLWALAVHLPLPRAMDQTLLRKRLHLIG